MQISVPGAAVVLAALFVLSACGPSTQAPTAASSAAPPASGALAGGPVEPTPPGKPSPFPQWLQIAQQAGGGVVQYHPASIQRNTTTGLADVWVQVIYTDPQTYVSEDATTRQTLTYYRERFLYTFDCNRALYAIVNRRIMGVGETIYEEIQTPLKVDERPSRPISTRGVASLALNPACKAVIAAP